VAGDLRIYYPLIDLEYLWQVGGGLFRQEEGGKIILFDQENIYLE